MAWEPEMTPLNPVEQAFLELFDAIRENKPNDRSQADRAFAIVNTELEKAYAYWRMYCADEGMEIDEQST